MAKLAYTQVNVRFSRLTAPRQCSKAAIRPASCFERHKELQMKPSSAHPPVLRVRTHRKKANSNVSIKTDWQGSEGNTRHARAVTSYRQTKGLRLTTSLRPAKRISGERIISSLEDGGSHSCKPPDARWNQNADHEGKMRCW